MGIFYKIALITISITGLISIISNSILIQRFSENMNDRNRLLIQEATVKVADLMLDKYNMMYNQQILIHSTDHVASIISTTRNNPSNIYKLENLSQISNYLKALGVSDADILDVILFTKDGTNAFSYSPVHGRRILLSYPYNSISYVQDFGDSDANITAVYDADPQYLTLNSAEASHKVITFLAKIYDTTNPAYRELNGYLMINISPETLENTYGELDTDADGNYVVVSNTDCIVYSNYPDYIGQQYYEGLIPASDILLKKSISISGITVIGSVSKGTLREKISGIIRQMILITFFGLILLIAAIIFLHRYYAKKFRRLTAAMKQIGNGDFSVTLPETSGDEIGELIQSFNTMRETLDLHIKKTYLAETRQRTAELYALQAQINPHFLNNTIESIRMKALSDGEYELSEMLANFGILFHWMTQLNDNIICVEDELEYIEAYLNMQKLRFGDKLIAQTDVPAETLFLGIPRFTLQPIVENTISHANKPSGEPLLISIIFRISGDTLILSVEDNGIGMPEDTLQKLRAHVYGEKEYPEFGIGLKNIHVRIQLLYGESYGLTIQSTEGQGSIIYVQLPAVHAINSDES